MRLTRLLVTVLVLLLFVPFIFAQDATILEHGGSIQSVEFSPVDNSVVASASDDHTIKLWNLRVDTAITLRGHTGQVNAVAFSPNGQLLASGSNDQTFKLWNIPQQQHIATFKHIPIVGLAPSQVNAVAFSPDGQSLASAGYQGVKLWDVDNQIETATLQHEDWVSAIVFSPNGERLAAVDGKQMKIWDVQNQQIITQLEGDADWIGAIAFSPDSQTFVSAGSDGQITLWSVSNWEVLGRIKTSGSVSDLAFSPDGKILASAGHEVGLWSVENGAKIASLTGHTGWIMEAAFSPDGTTIASGGLDDGTLRVQNIKTHLESEHQRNTVRLIYFLPSDRSPQSDIDVQLDTLIKKAQQIYANQMAHYGFGRKTFTFETDATGKAVVHHVKGKFKDEYYHNQSGMVWEEIDDEFDLSKNIYFTALDVSAEDLEGFACSFGGHTAFGGTVLIPASGWCFEEIDVTIHELGHAFGLHHDYRNNLKPWIDSYSTEPMSTSACAAEWLDAHPYFNADPIYFNERTTIEMWSPAVALPHGIRFRFKINDPDGLHQAQLVSTLEYEKAFELSILDCKSLDGSTNVVEFVTDPSTVKIDSVTLRVIDVYGNFTEKEFPINSPPEDLNLDGTVNIQDLVLVATNFGQQGLNRADVNGDGAVNITDLVLVARALGNDAAAPSAWHIDLEITPTRVDVQQWLREARQVDLTDPAFQRGILMLEQLLAALTPKETALLPNYPNPFNPETWIPYQLAELADVSISIYTADGKLVRTLALGHQPMGIYESRSRAAYWDGKNQVSESVASGVYFYTLTAGDFTATRKMLILK